MLHLRAAETEREEAGEERSRESWRALDLDVSLPLKGRICASTTAEGEVHWLAETSRPPGLKVLSIDISIPDG